VAWSGAQFVAVGVGGAILTNEAVILQPADASLSFAAAPANLIVLSMGKLLPADLRLARLNDGYRLVNLSNQYDLRRIQ
jgi:hypothetical protein